MARAAVAAVAAALAVLPLAYVLMGVWGGGGGETLVLPLAPGDTITLEYILLSSDGSGWRVLDRHEVTLRVLEVSWPFIVTDGGVIPVTFIRPIVNGSNPHMVYVSFYFHDRFCLPVYPSGDANGYTIAPRRGCAPFLGELRVRSDGLLDTARIVRAVGGTLLAEEVHLVGIARRVNDSTTVRLGRPLCLGPLSYSLEYTAPGAYIFMGGRVVYLGRPAEGIATVYLKKGVDGEKWSEYIRERPAGVQVVVSSPFMPLDKG